jgi:hypothetical protein
MIKKRKVSPVKIMLNYWIIVPSMRKCNISFTSWITHIAAGLNLLQNATLTCILDIRRIIGYDFFFHAHMLKRSNTKIIMIYKNFTNEYELPNRELGIYFVQTYTFLDSRAIIGRCTSTCISGRTSRPNYTGADLTPLGTAYFHFIGFDEPGTSHEPHQP